MTRKSLSEEKACKVRSERGERAPFEEWDRQGVGGKRKEDSRPREVHLPRPGGEVWHLRTEEQNGGMLRMSKVGLKKRRLKPDHAGP